MPFIDMDVTAVRELMTGLAETARDLEDGWRARAAGIADAENAFGGDAVGRAISGSYRPAGDMLRELATRLPGQVAADADLGRQSAADYEAADALAAATLGVRLGLGADDARA